METIFKVMSMCMYVHRSKSFVSRFFYSLITSKNLTHIYFLSFKVYLTSIRYDVDPDAE